MVQPGEVGTVRSYVDRVPAVSGSLAVVGPGRCVAASCPRRGSASVCLWWDGWRRPRAEVCIEHVGQVALLYFRSSVAVLRPVQPVLNLVPRQVFRLSPAPFHELGLDLSFPGFVPGTL